MARLQQVLAVSADGYVAKGPDDDMRWTGPADKAVFRMLTFTGNAKLGVSRRTGAMMPGLPGREVVTITRDPRTKNEMTLEQFARHNHKGWLIGGQELCMAAMNASLLSDLWVVRNDRALGPELDYRKEPGIRFALDDILKQGYEKAMTTRVQAEGREVRVDLWREVGHGW